MSLSRKQLTLSAVIIAIFATGGSFLLFQENADAKATPAANSQPATTHQPTNTTHGQHARAHRIVLFDVSIALFICLA